ncbi:SMC family ATPase [Skermania sp. ID1734]|uniref:AAA family ATPase n=1 Tax=Skermania sp. ID1734 TaxID=2597516 RepID=UPI00117DB6FE|nr:SMC family ATPase [Skermania sp. ID1734]TSE01970.1 SMC family ATPase [Skermania sp. ID1734]
MRLHRLEVHAFGPFAGNVEVDFDALGADGLFLLHGDTGAGKTTVLDAIAFALYGTVPGSRRECKRLHSDLAAADAVPHVVLEATIAGRRLRISRHPEFQRPKRRGTGMRTENAKATLTWLDGRGQNLTRLNEIGDEVNRLLGMSADQFFQVVLLPQGEFARFLRSDNDDRERLLERLFDTERFGSAEQWLAQRRRESAAQLEGSRQAVQRLAAQASTAAGVEHPPEDSADQVLVWAQDVLAGSRSAYATAETGLDEATSRAATASEALSEGRRIADLHRRAAHARAELAEYRATSAERQRLADELDTAQRAAPIVAILAERDDVLARTGELRAAAQRYAAELTQLGAEPDVLSCGSADELGRRIDAAIERWINEAGRLDELIAAAARAQQLGGDLDSLSAQLAQLDTQVGTARIRRAQLPADRRAVTDELQSAVQAAARVAALRMERDRAADILTAADEHAAVRPALARALDELAERRAAHLDARELVLELRARRLAGMAAELAGELNDGEPCRVCGSVSHPAPAEQRETVVSAEAEELAASAEQRAAAAVDVAVGQVTELQRQVDVLENRCGGMDPVPAAARLANVAAELSVTEGAAARMTDLEARISELDAEDAALAASLLDSEARRSAVSEKIQLTQARLADAQAQLAQARGADGSASQRRERLRRLARCAAQWRDALAEARAAEAAANSIEAKLMAALAEQGFTDADTARAAIRSAEFTKNGRSRLQIAEEQRIRAAATLAEPDIIEALTVPEPNVDGLERVHAEAAERLRSAIATRAEAARRLRETDDIVTQLWAAVDRLLPQQKRHEELADLADTVAGRGQNSRRMSLRSYVLAARLEEVAIAASARLERMSAGRYEFVHSDAAGPRGKRGGLGLDIRDDYTGAVRPAKTLSGGETFLASLALALGLADVVSAESGGLVLDTMFIDEGFGSLDSDTLDAVMGVLDELRAGGRVVGIVSHVDELRQRIPSRLHVIRDRAGSRLHADVGVLAG